MAFFTGTPPGKNLFTAFWGSSTTWTLAALPLFIWMGEILFRTRLSEDMFSRPLTVAQPLPGTADAYHHRRLWNLRSMSGSSAATAATISKVTIPELRKRGYDESMAVGSLAGAGTLGMSDPAFDHHDRVRRRRGRIDSRLFVAGVSSRRPADADVLRLHRRSGRCSNPKRTPPRDEFSSLQTRLCGTYLIPAILLIGVVIGSIYAGVATPTEAAAIGVSGALALAAVSGSLTWKNFEASVMGATRTSCMIAFILAGAAFLTVAMGFTGVPRILAKWIGDQGFSAWQLIAVLTVLYMILGCFIDGISMVVLTSSVILPSVKAAGIDLLWFGIFVVLVVEMAQITPPVGFNLFVLQGLTGKNMFYVARASLPFFVLMVLAVAIIWQFPEVVTYLPGKMFKLG